MRRRQRRLGVLALAALGWTASSIAHADVTTDKSASILVFPKVVSNDDRGRGTVIQIGNTSNSLVRAHCFYVNAALANPELPQGPLNQPLWQEIDFTIQLTKQQPTQWTVAEGRLVDPTDLPCITKGCQAAGFDPGRIPPVVPDFEGELKCIEVDDSGAPLSGNHLKGEATLVSNERAFGVEATISGLAKYNAIGILGEENNGDDVLVLGGGQCSGNGAICNEDDDCGDQGPCVREYNACPQTWIVNHLADGAPDLVLQDSLLDEPGSSSVFTELTIVPCTQNYETQIPTTVTLQFITFNEFESQFSVSTSITCWANFLLSDLGATAMTVDGQPLDPSGTVYLQSRIRPAAGTPYGILMVGEEFHFARPSTATLDIFGTPAAMNLHVEGERPVPDLITIPADQLVP